MRPARSQNIVTPHWAACAGAIAVLVWLCASVWAQTPPAPGTPPPAAPASTMLPTIKVTAPHAKKRGVTAQAAATPAPAAAKPPSPYVTGARNVGGGPPIVPSAASQMTVTGQDLNNRAVTRPGEILEAAPGLAMVDHAD